MIRITVSAAIPVYRGICERLSKDAGPDRGIGAPASTDAWSSTMKGKIFKCAIVLSAVILLAIRSGALTGCGSKDVPVSRTETRIDYAPEYTGQTGLNTPGSGGAQERNFWDNSLDTLREWVCDIRNTAVALYGAVTGG